MKCSPSLTFYLFSPTSLINSKKHEHSCKILCFLTLCLLSNFACFIVIWFFSKSFFSPKHSFRTSIGCQTAWIQIRPNVLSGLISVQRVKYSFVQILIWSAEGEMGWGGGYFSWFFVCCRFFFKFNFKPYRQGFKRFGFRSGLTFWH